MVEKVRVWLSCVVYSGWQEEKEVLENLNVKACHLAIHYGWRRGLWDLDKPRSKGSPDFIHLFKGNSGDIGSHDLCAGILVSNHRWGNRGSERLNNLPKFTQLGRTRKRWLQTGRFEGGALASGQDGHRTFSQAEKLCSSWPQAAAVSRTCKENARGSWTWDYGK